MKPFITRSDIAAAEYRLAQAKHDAHTSFTHVRSAIGSRLTQPSSLLVVTGVGALLGVWFARRNKRAARQAGVSAWTPIVGVVFTLLTRFGMQHLAGTWTRPRADATPDNPTRR